MFDMGCVRGQVLIYIVVNFGVSTPAYTGAAEAPAARNESKYAILEQSQLIQPLTFETLGIP
jgi:hypothetical protein